MEWFEFDCHTNELSVLPTIGIMRTAYMDSRFKLRVVFWWIFWQVSIGIWRNRR